MPLTRRIIPHERAGAPFESVAVLDDDGVARPGILLFPNVLGMKDADFAYAERVAALGYTLLVADIYGRGKRTTRADPDPAMHMNALNADRAELRARVNAALDVLRALPEVDANRTAAIGFCFGGKCVLDLGRSGADIAGGINFHGVYDPPPFPNAAIKAKLLICHGWDDPIAPPDAMVALASELTEAGCDWQVHAYGHTAHAFTDHSADMPERGIVYDEAADRRSFAALVAFLAETLG